MNPKPREDMPRKTAKAEPVKIQTNKEIVIEKHPKAECIKTKSGFFHICVKSGKNTTPVHSGLAKNESDAWKKAAHEVM